MNLNESFVLVIEYMISECKNKEVIEKFQTIIDGIKNKKFIEETKHPRFQSIDLFGYNLFIFSDNDYIEMAEYLLANKRTIL